MALQDFFVSGLPPSKAKTQPAITDVDQSKSDQTQTKISDVETRMNVSVKNSEIILLEDHHNSNSNCLVLDVGFSHYSRIRIF